MAVWRLWHMYTLKERTALQHEVVYRQVWVFDKLIHSGIIHILMVLSRSDASALVKVTVRESTDSLVWCQIPFLRPRRAVQFGTVGLQESRHLHILCLLDRQLALEVGNLVVSLGDSLREDFELFLAPLSMLLGGFAIDMSPICKSSVLYIIGKQLMVRLTLESRLS